MSKLSKKALLERFETEPQVLKTYPAPHIEDREDIIQTYREQLIKQGASEDDILVDENKISIGNQFWLLPKHPRDGEPVSVKVRSKDIVTTNIKGVACYGDIKDWQIANDGISLIHKNGARLQLLQ